MQQETALLWWWLNVLTFKRYQALKQVYGNLDEAAKDLSPRMLKELSVREDALMGAVARLQHFHAKAYVEKMQSLGVDLLTIEDNAYPSSLREIGDPPVFLSYRGDLTLLDEQLIGVVGTRSMSTYGRRIVEHFVPAFVRAGLVTVSGLALGVDCVAACETMKHGGKTVAVLGHGLSKVYPPSNSALAQKILEHGGLLLSEFPLEAQPDKYTFPARNRIIAALAAGTLICEAPEKSGSIITAELALEYNRDVYCACGQIFDKNFAGCHRLISEGRAKLVTHPDDILCDFGKVVKRASAPSEYAPQSPVEAAIYTSLTTMPQILDELAEKTGLSTPTISAALTMLELAGAVQNVGGGQWVKCGN